VENTETTSQIPSQAPPTQPVSQPPAANAPAGQPAVQTTPPGAASFAFDPPAIQKAKGSTFEVNVLLNGAQNAYSVPLQVNYDPKMLQVVNVSSGNFLSKDGQAVALVHRDDDTSGTLQITASRPPGSTGVTGQGTIVTLTFMAKEAGQCNITISKGGVRDPAMQPTLVAGSSATVTIQ